MDGAGFQTSLIKTNNNSNLIWAVVTRRGLLLSCGCASRACVWVLLCVFVNHTDQLGSALQQWLTYCMGHSISDNCDICTSGSWLIHTQTRAVAASPCHSRGSMSRSAPLHMRSETIWKPLENYQLDKIIGATWQSERPALTRGDNLSRAPCIQNWGLQGIVGRIVQGWFGGGCS